MPDDRLAQILATSGLRPRMSHEVRKPQVDQMAILRALAQREAEQRFLTGPQPYEEQPLPPEMPAPPQLENQPITAAHLDPSMLGVEERKRLGLYGPGDATDRLRMEELGGRNDERLYSLAQEAAMQGEMDPLTARIAYPPQSDGVADRLYASAPRRKRLKR